MNTTSTFSEYALISDPVDRGRVAQLEPLFLIVKSAKGTGTQSPTIPRTFRSSVELFLARHGIERFNFHRLRHTFATRCIEAGVDAKTTSELLGHANVNITLNLYVHPNAEAKRAAVDKMAAAFGGCKEGGAR